MGIVSTTTSHSAYQAGLTLPAETPGSVALLQAECIDAWLRYRAKLVAPALVGTRQVLIVSESQPKLAEARVKLQAAGHTDSTLLFRGSIRSLLSALPFTIDLLMLDFGSANPPWQENLQLAAAYLSKGSRLIVANADGGFVSTPKGSTFRLMQVDGESKGVFAVDSNIEIRLRLSRVAFRHVAAALWRRFEDTGLSIEESEILQITRSTRAELLASGRSVTESPQWPYAAPRILDFGRSLPDGTAWPRISVVTPSFNSGTFLEETVLSILNQGYPNLEYIVVDGGSTDTTVSILQKYSLSIAWWVSEPDKGQSDAINKGMARTTGEIVTWLNADDMLAPRALFSMAYAFWRSKADIVAGVCQVQREGVIAEEHLTSASSGPLHLEHLLNTADLWLRGAFFYQPEVFFRRDLWLRAGGKVEESLHFVMDYQMWLRFAADGATLSVIGAPIAIFRVHAAQKTFTPDRYIGEMKAVASAFAKSAGISLNSQGQAVELRQSLSLVVIDLSLEGGGAQQWCKLLSGAGHNVQYVRPGLDSLVSREPQILVKEELDAIFGAAKPDRFIVVGDGELVADQAKALGQASLRSLLLFDSPSTPSVAKTLLLLKRLENPLALAASSPILAALLEGQTGFSDIAVLPLWFDSWYPDPPSRPVARHVLDIAPEAFVVFWPCDDLLQEADASRLLNELSLVLSPNDLLITGVSFSPANKPTTFKTRTVRFTGNADAARVGACADVVLVSNPHCAHALATTQSLGAVALVSSDLPLGASEPSAVRYSGSREGELALWLARLRHSSQWLKAQAKDRKLDSYVYGGRMSALHQVQLTLLALHPDLTPNLVAAPHRGANLIESEFSVGWTYENNVGPVEGPSLHVGLGRYRWLCGPTCTFRFVTSDPGPRILFLALRNELDYQSVRIRLNGELVGSHEVPVADALCPEANIFQPVNIAGDNHFEFEFSTWVGAPSAQRDRACMMTRTSLFHID